MNKKLVFLAMLVSLLALTLVFASCNTEIPGDGGTGGGDETGDSGDGTGGGDGTGNDGPNVFTITGITTELKNYSMEICVVGMYPTNTTVDQALLDLQRIYGLASGSLQYIVAGREVYHNAATGTEGNWTETGTLKSAESKFTQDWRGHGTFISYWLLRDNYGTYRAYKLKTPRTISEGDTTSVHAVNDFKLVLTQ
jgi:hypothetical protein